MKCTICGAQVPEGDKFCYNCGAKIEEAPVRQSAEPAEPIEPKFRPQSGIQTRQAGRFSKKTLIVLVTAAVVVFAGLGAAVALSGGGGAEYTAKIEEAQKFVDSGDYESAIKTYDDAIAIKPKKADAYIGKADIYIFQGNYTEAEKTIEEGESKAGESKFTEKKQTVKVYKSNDESLRKGPLATVEEEYQRGSSKGGIISSLDITKIGSNAPRWIETSLRDSDRVMTITLKESREGKIKTIAKKDVRLGGGGQGDDYLGARYNVYTCVSGEKMYLCIGYSRALLTHMEAIGIMVYEISEDSILDTTICTVNTDTAENSTYIDGKNVASCPSQVDGEDYDAHWEVYTAAIDDGIKKINDKLGSLGFGEAFSRDENGFVDSESAFFDVGRKACHRNMSYIQFGEYGTDDKLTDLMSASTTYIEDYTDLRERLAADKGSENKGGQTDPTEEKYGSYMEKVIDAYSKGNYAEAEKYSAMLPETVEEMEVSDEERQAYTDYYESEIQNGTVDEDFGYHFITDIDKDGKSEFVLKTGSYEAEYMLRVLQYRDGRIHEVGEVGAGHSSFYQYPAHNGIIRMMQQMGSEIMTVIKLENGKLTEQKIGNRGENNELQMEDYLRPGCYMGEW